MTSAAHAPVSIIGLGNTEKRDDGVGVAVVEGLREELEAGDWAPSADRQVAVVAAGTDSLLAAAHAIDGRWLVLVDAARMGLAPGDCRFFAGSEVRCAPRATGLAPHDADLAQSIDLLAGLGCVERVMVMGIEAQDFGNGRGLSRPVAARLSQIRERIKEEVGRLP